MSSINNLKADHKNARKRTNRSAELIKESLQRYGAARSIVIDEDNRILAGNGTVEGAKAAGIQNVRIIESEGDEIIAIRRKGLTEDEKVGLALADNRTADLSDWDREMLHRLSQDHDLEPWFNADDLSGLAEPETFEDFDQALEDSEDETDGSAPSPGTKLSDRFGIAPFTILNAREGWWQERKRQWIALGIQSEVGRKGNLLGMSETMLEPDEKLREMKALMRDHGTQTANIEMLPGYYTKKNQGLTDEQIIEEYLASGAKAGGTSIFDPVLAELAYRWFSRKRHHP